MQPLHMRFGLEIGSLNPYTLVLIV